MKKILALAFVLALTASLFAQDPFFSHQNYGLSLINPAYAGAAGCARAEMGYRTQWRGTYQTFNAAYDQRFAVGGASFNYSRDVAGHAIFTDRFDLNYAYGFGLLPDDEGKPRITVQPGVQVSYYRKAVDWGQLMFGDQIDPRHGVVYPSSQIPSGGARNCFDVSAGLLAYSKRILFGFSTYHLTQPDEGIVGTSRLPMRFVVHAAGIIGNAEMGGNGFSLIPSVIYMQQQNFSQITGLVTAKYRSVSVGAGYRDKDAVIMTVGYTRWNFTLGYSYDMTVSRLGNTGGAHELHLAYCFLQDKFASRSNVRMFL